jgi:type I restriction enzyme S subunit
MAINQDLKGLLPRNKGELLPEYLYYWYLSIAPQVISMGTGATVQGVKIKDISSLPILVPPVEEQRYIVKKLDKIHDQLVQLTSHINQQIEEARSLRQAVLQSRLMARNLSPELNSLANRKLANAQGRELTLGEICEVDWGNTKLTKKSYVEGGKYLAVSAAGADGRIDHAEHAAHTPVLSAIGANCGRMFLPDESFTAIKNTITFTPKPDSVRGDFLFFLLQSVQLPIRGAGQPFITKGDIQKFPVTLPPLNAQKRIVDELEAFDSKIEELKAVLSKQNAELIAFKAAALAGALAGGS